ncbi:MAG: transglycosylase SLT domain-containing protein [bacterium]
MKRYICIGVCMVWYVLLCAPSFAFFGKENPRAAHEDFQNLPKVASHLKKRYTDDLGGLMERRYIRVLTAFNKTNFFISNGALYGFEYALLKGYEKFLNKGIKRSELRVVLEYIPVARDEMIPMLNEGSGDIVAAGLTITPERREEVDFTIPYLDNINEVVVVNDRITDITRLEDLSGRDVFVRESSSYYESLVALNKGFLQESRPPVNIVKADETLETEDILELVNSGAIAITISDSHIADIWEDFFEHINILRNLKVREGARIAWMVRKNNPEIRQSMNRFIKTHKKGTLLGNIYFKRYYKQNKWIKNPLNEQERQKLATYVDLFKEYAPQYGFDWRLIMAQAYQESGLDHSKKSRSGATGIMQIKPSTAADQSVGIADVHDVKNNIRAGIKYLAHLRDHYFQDPNLSARDRIRFVLAAYNAGPSRIKALRKSAQQMGLDPNRWFRNVEMAALKYIGQETVQYVSNINKYYIIYTIGLDEI